MSIARLRRERQQVIDKVNAAMADTGNGGNSRDDDRFWKLFLDKEKGTGYARIRFLPAKDGETLPFVKLHDHFIKGPSGKYYVENSLTTIGKKDPCQELVGRMFNSGIESDKAAARQAGILRRTNYYANILVEEDPANRANEGKVFLYRFGPKIFEMVQAASNPEFADSPKIYPFDLWDGASFVLRVRKIRSSEGEFWNYDKSGFEAISELFIGNDAKKEEVWAKCHELQPFITPDKFKSYDELKQNLLDVLGPMIGSGIEVAPGLGIAAEMTAHRESAPARRVQPANKPSKPAVDEAPWGDDEPKVTRSASPAAASVTVDTGDDMEAFFNAAR